MAIFCHLVFDCDIMTARLHLVTTVLFRIEVKIYDCKSILTM